MDTEQESPLTFPCRFPIKAMGLTSDKFQATVISLVRKHTPGFSDATVSSRPSTNKKYLAVTVTIEATSRDQLDKIYEELTACPLIIMAL